MDEIKSITTDDLRLLVNEKGFPEQMLAKDYYITILLYLIKDIPGLYFKRGTALNKMFLNYARLSEDIDFTLTRDVGQVRKQIKEVIEESKIFDRITKDKRVDKFIRLIVHYTDPLGNDGTVFINLNRKANLTLPPEKHKVPHFYDDNIPSFSVATLNQKEMFAEKMKATIERNKPRDHFDMYQIIKNNLPLDLKLVAKKCEDSGCIVDIPRMFNRANHLTSSHALKGGDSL
ncbi:MAG: nucleotidyl transferase AbiEii/AbiGii toxin family protein [Nanoarchaeota archaeon]|nr:nucleotidyl transferase AbiEii/AbiGii toxin family protein [Nanoarchaeota archaeon]